MLIVVSKQFTWAVWNTDHSLIIKVLSEWPKPKVNKNKVNPNLRFFVTGDWPQFLKYYAKV